MNALKIVLPSVCFFACCFGDITLYQYNQPTQVTLPDRFRIVETKPFKVSASEQFSRDNLQHMLRLYPEEPLIIVDLRGEFHGFSDGQPISWMTEEGDYKVNSLQYNFGISEEELIEKEDSLLGAHDHYISEKTLIESLDARIQYLRIPLTDHHCPSDTQVDFFVEWIKNLPPSSWIHFHCAGGKGRTALFLCMIDMIQYADIASPKDLMEKQTKLGGSTLYRPKGLRSSTSHEEARYEFLCLFHKYCLDAKNTPQTWSSWIQQQKAEELVSYQESPNLFHSSSSRRNRG